MNAVVMEAFGPPEVLKLREVPNPSPGEGEVLIQVFAVSVNRSLDVRVRQNGDRRNPKLPLILGVDPSGVVAALGPGVTRWKIGDRVAANGPIRCGQCKACRAGHGEECTASQHLGVHRPGGYAEYIAVPQQNVVAVPDNLDFPQATVIVRHFPTAFLLLMEKAGLKPGETVLIMGAAGALGNAGIQVARLIGADVIAAAGSDERVRSAMELGARWGVNYRRQDLAQAVMEITDGQGVDVVFENIGDPTLWPGAFYSLGGGGRLVTAGAHGGGTVPLDVRRLYQRRLKILGGAGATAADVDRALDAAKKGQIQAVIDRVLPLSAAAEAHRMVEENTVIGKIVLDPTQG